MAKLLYVEDDLALASAVKDWLETSHTVDLAESGEDALQLIENFDYEVLLIDWDLPGIAGVEVCRKYRARGGNAWVVFVTARNDIASIEEALELGGDDYISKPFDPRELSARLKASLRRTKTAFKAELTIGQVRLDPGTKTLHAGEESVHLMPKECALLEYLMRNTDVKFSTRELLSAVWSSEKDVSEGIVRTYMSQLRKKLESLGQQNLIQSPSSRGYIIYSQNPVG